MTADRLLTHFDRISEAPDAVPRLRRFILDLAVRGKLVEQDPNDEPVPELLKRMEAEKLRLSGRQRLRQDSLERDAAGAGWPFVIPASWSWARVGTAALRIDYGTSVRSYEFGDGIPVLKMGDIQDGQVRLGGQTKVPRNIDDLPGLFLKHYDLLYNRTNSPDLVGKTGIYLGGDDVYTFASYLIRIRFSEELVNPIFANLAMNAPYFRETQIAPEIRQQCGQANVNGTKLRNMAIPLPPIVEQHRIVARVEELIALCDGLEAAQAERERRRDRLTAASLQRLNRPDESGEVFREHVRFHLTHFASLAARSKQIQQLRQTLLNLAVSGALTEQKRGEEQVGQRYIDEPLSSKLPENWRLLNFGKFCDIQGGNQPPKSRFIHEPRAGYVRLFQIRDLGETPVPTYVPKGTTNRFCREHEILIGRYGASIGKVFWAQDGAYNVALAKFVYPGDAFTPAFAFLVLKSDFFQAHLIGTTRSAQAGFNKGDLSGVVFPLPPLAEQHRIVAKVEELTLLCDGLDGQLSNTQREGCCLLEAVLHEALSTAA